MFQEAYEEGREEEGGPQPAPDDQAYSEFLVLIKNLAGEITAERQLEMLGFFEGIAVAEVRGKSALELLSDMMRKGRFSHTNLEPLQRRLREIDRSDLVRVVDKYQQKYAAQLKAERARGECECRYTNDLTAPGVNEPSCRC